MSFVEVDDTGRLWYEQFEKFLRPNTRLVVVTHASNVTGDLTDLAFVSAFAKSTVLRWSWTRPRLRAHGPSTCRRWGGCSLFHRTQGAAGSAGDRRAVCPPWLTMAPCGGRQRYPQLRRNTPLSDAYSAGSGTLNVPGLAGLGAGVEWILSQGVEALHEKEMALTRLFYEKIVHAPGVKIYGSFDETDRAPIVS